MRIGEKIIEWAIRICGVSAIFFVFGIFIFVFKEGSGFFFERFEFTEFFLSAEWRPTSPTNPTYGTLALFSGTLAVVVL